MYVVNHPGVLVQITIKTMNLIYWTYFDRGYVSLPILAASSNHVVLKSSSSSSIILINDFDYILLVKFPGSKKGKMLNGPRLEWPI